MKYITESYNSLSSAYDDLAEKYETSFDNYIHETSRDAYDVEVIETPTTIIVGCLKHDSSPMDFFEDDDGQGTFKEFRSVDERDEFLSTLKKSSLFYLVDKYAHGNVHYSISNTRNYPDQRWDVAHGCAVFIPCDYIQDEYKKSKKQMTVAEAKAKYIADSNSTLESYSDYCNGEVYGYSVVVYDKQCKVIEEQECWGYIGNKNANDEKTSIMKNEFLNSYVQEIIKNLEIVNFSNTNIIPNINPETLQTIHKNIDFNNVKLGKYVEVYGEKILTVVHNGENNSFVYHDNGLDKPVIARFEMWQKEHGVTPEKFSEARFLSDLKSVIRKNLENQIEKKLTLK